MLKQRESIPKETSKPVLFDFSNANVSPDSVNRRLDVYQRSKSRDQSTGRVNSIKKDVSPGQFEIHNVQMVQAKTSAFEGQSKNSIKQGGGKNH